MTREQELELIKQIIWDGYSNLDVISFELDIPIAELVALERQVDIEKRAFSKFSIADEKIRARKKEIANRLRTVTYKL